MIKDLVWIGFLLCGFVGQARAHSRCSDVFQNRQMVSSVKSGSVTEVTLEPFDFIERVEVDGYLEELPLESVEISRSGFLGMLRLGKERVVEVLLLKYLRKSFFKQHQFWLEDKGFEYVDSLEDYRFRGKFRGKDSIEGMLYQLHTGFRVNISWDLLSNRPAFKFRDNGSLDIFINDSFIEHSALARQQLEEALWAAKRHKYSPNAKKAFGFVLTEDLGVEVVGEGVHPMAQRVQRVVQDNRQTDSAHSRKGRIHKKIHLSFEEGQISDDAIGIQVGKNQVILRPSLLAQGQEKHFVEVLLHEEVHAISTLASLRDDWSPATARYFAGRVIEFRSVDGKKFTGLSQTYEDFFRADEVEANLKTYSYWKDNSNNKIQYNRVSNFIDWQLMLLEESLANQIIREKSVDGQYGIKIEAEESTFKVVVDIAPLGYVSRINTFGAVREIVEDRIKLLKKQKQRLLELM